MSLNIDEMATVSNNLDSLSRMVDALVDTIGSDEGRRKFAELASGNGWGPIEASMEIHLRVRDLVTVGLLEFGAPEDVNEGTSLLLASALLKLAKVDAATVTDGAS